MKHHLSHEQFAQCFVGEATSAERQHVSECPECRAELERFGRTIASFRTAVRDRVDIRVASPGLSPLPARTASDGSPKWRPALAAAAAILLGIFPFLMTERELPEIPEDAAAETNANALMDAINLHLLRSVPAPMQPAMAVIPNNESSTESGGTQ